MKYWRTWGKYFFVGEADLRSFLCWWWAVCWWWSMFFGSGVVWLGLRVSTVIEYSGRGPPSPPPFPSRTHLGVYNYFPSFSTSALPFVCLSVCLCLCLCLFLPPCLHFKLNNYLRRKLHWFTAFSQALAITVEDCDVSFPVLNFLQGMPRLFKTAEYLRGQFFSFFSDRRFSSISSGSIGQGQSVRICSYFSLQNTFTFSKFTGI